MNYCEYCGEDGCDCVVDTYDCPWCDDRDVTPEHIRTHIPNTHGSNPYAPPTQSTIREMKEARRI